MAEMSPPSTGASPSPRSAASWVRGSSRATWAPAALLAHPEIQRRTAVLSEQGKGGHIVNLGHRILPLVLVENARAFVEAVKGVDVLQPDGVYTL